MKPEQTIHAGGCACGQLTFRASGEPRRVGLCHCMTCRKVSGSAFNAFAVFSADQVEIDGRFERWSAGQTVRCFCPVCASRAFSLEGDEIEIGLGAFDEPSTFRPTYEAWVPRREHWLATGGLTAYQKNRSDG
ncbi:GFA family protein [Microvirga rosea]|uniref:GFA family protein n=1 Tax=Microvirga rosea TaxID=2715425 RepID=UPI001D0B7A49|nr:GFA family protein [Microvirga rosea]MCB8819082.1 GFA family protein [Microvirga rosea]